MGMEALETVVGYWEDALAAYQPRNGINHVLTTGRLLGAQSFTSLMADLCQDINRVSSFRRCHNGIFP